MSITVDFPAPFGPSRATVSPTATARSILADRFDGAVRSAVGLAHASKLDSHLRIHGFMLPSEGLRAVEPGVTTWA